MTPFEVEILLHYHCSNSDYRDGDFSAPIVKPTLEGFVECGLLQRSEGAAKYAATEATHAFVNAVCKVPRPVLQWIVPEGEQR